MASDDVTTDTLDEESTEALEEEDPKEALKKVIRVKVADAGVLRRTVHVTVPQEHLQSEFDKEYDGLVADAEVPGFRKGRAPRRLVEKRFGRDVDSQVRTRIVSNAYLAAIEKEDLKVLGDPLVWVRVKKEQDGDEAGNEQLVEMHAALDHLTMTTDKDFDFRCEVEIKPEFKLPKLEGITIEKPKLEISDEDISVQIDRMRAQRGNWAPVVADGRVEIDDLLVCDMKMSVGGKEIKTVDNMAVAARAQAIEGAVVSDLGKTLKGAKTGETRSVSAELPADYEVEDLRGKKADFELRVNEIKRLQLPPLDEAFLAAQGFDSEDEYRSWVRQRMEAQLEHEIRQGMRNQVSKALLDNTELDLPEGLSSRQTDRVASRRAMELQRQGVPISEIEKRADEMRTSAREEAVSQLKLHFILEEIAQKLEIEVSEEEINGQIAAMARAYNRRFDRVRDDLAKNDGITSLYLEIRDEKSIEKILDKAEIIETTQPEKGLKTRKKKKKTAATNRAAQATEKEAKPKAKAKTAAAAKPAKAASKATTKKTAKKKTSS